MTGDNSRKSDQDFSYVDNTLHAFYEGRYRDGITILRDALEQQVQRGEPIDVKELVKHTTTALSYLEFRLEDESPESKINSHNETERRCSFCSKKQNEVAKLIAGPDVFICDGCIKACSEILASSGISQSVTQ